MTAERPQPACESPAGATGRPRPRTGLAARFATRDVLANPGSVIAASVAVFLAVFALLTSRVAAGRDPGLTRPLASLSASPAAAGGALRTTASGRVIAAAPAAGAPASVPGAPAPALRTSASGAAANGGEDG